MKSLFRLLLWPFSALYGGIMRFRNHLYDIGYKKSFQFQTMVMSVGNLSVGGNGKTPMVEYLLRLLANDYRIAVLSRGYGRSSRGFQLATSHHTAMDIGDEPLQIFQKFQPSVEVAVGESRTMAIPKILFERPDVEMIILDDAFQHRSVDPHFSILVTDYRRPFFNDFVLPSGRLREPRSGVRRANMVVVTKCPEDLSDVQKQLYTRRIQQYTEVPVYFAAIQYHQPLHFHTGRELEGRPAILLVTGIARPGPLVEFISNHYSLVGHMQFRDHYNYETKQLDDIKRRFSGLPGTSKIVLTTEKDAVRLRRFKSELQELPLYYLPIEMRFIEKQHIFNQQILNCIGSVKNSNT